MDAAEIHALARAISLASTDMAKIFINEIRDVLEQREGERESALLADRVRALEARVQLMSVTPTEDGLYGAGMYGPEAAPPPSGPIRMTGPVAVHAVEVLLPPQPFDPSAYREYPLYDPTAPLPRADTEPA